MGKNRSEDDLEEVMDEVERHRMPLLDHLRELRTRIMWAALAIGLGMLASLAFTEEILAFLRAPFDLAIEQANAEGGLSLVNSPFEGIYTWLAAAFFGGLALASPMVALQGWLFIAPGLYSSEKKLVVPLAFVSTGLFFAGAAFCYYVIFPFAFPFFITVIADVQANISISGYLTAVLKMMAAFGLSFQLPVATFFAARIGLLDHTDMITGFRYAIVGIFVLAAIITPPDVLTQSLLAAPLIVLYILSIGVAWMFTTKVREPLAELKPPADL